MKLGVGGNVQDTHRGRRTPTTHDCSSRSSVRLLMLDLNIGGESVHARLLAVHTLQNCKSVAATLPQARSWSAVLYWWSTVNQAGSQNRNLRSKYYVCWREKKKKCGHVDSQQTPLPSVIWLTKIRKRYPKRTGFFLRLQEQFPLTWKEISSVFILRIFQHYGCAESVDCSFLTPWLLLTSTAGLHLEGIISNFSFFGKVVWVCFSLFFPSPLDWNLMVCLVNTYFQGTLTKFDFSIKFSNHHISLLTKCNHPYKKVIVTLINHGGCFSLQT